MPNPNSNRGPWCAICETEMNRPNHRFQVRYEEMYMARRYHGELLPGFEPICGESCLQKAQARWADGKAISGIPEAAGMDDQADGVKQ